MNTYSSSPARALFDHEKLEVYRAAVAFAAWLELLLGEVTRAGSIVNQLERASISIPLNILPDVNTIGELAKKVQELNP